MKTLNTRDWTPNGTVTTTLRRHGLDPRPGARYAVYVAGWREAPELFYQAETEVESELLHIAHAHGLLVELDGRPGHRPVRRAG
jgi:hypothetical protein